MGKSFCFVSLRIEKYDTLNDIGLVVGRIWNRLNCLKSGVLYDLDIERKHRKAGNLSVLIGYGSKIFDIPGCFKSKPVDISKLNFKNPNPAENSIPILDGSDFRYSANLAENHLLNDQIVLQFIAENEFYTNRAVVELWKELTESEKKSVNIRISGLYFGFRHEDQRSWLGFHDGVSNLKPNERPYVIIINPKSVSNNDIWLVNGNISCLHQSRY